MIFSVLNIIASIMNTSIDIPNSLSHEKICTMIKKSQYGIRGNYEINITYRGFNFIIAQFDHYDIHYAYFSRVAKYISTWKYMENQVINVRTLEEFVKFMIENCVISH